MNFNYNLRPVFNIGRKCDIEIKLLNENHDGIPVVFAPGFLTHNDENWLNRISKIIYAPIIYVNWKSSSFTKILDEITKLLHIIPPPFNIIPVLPIPFKLLKLWNHAVNEAIFAGNDLAKILNDVWDNDDKAIFIGHSLGVKLITTAMQKLTHDSVITSVAIAGAINKHDYELDIKNIKTEGNIIHHNFYSHSDYILSILYKLMEFNTINVPIGIARSDLVNVQNHLTNIGHLEYLEDPNFEIMLLNLYNELINKL